MMENKPLSIPRNGLVGEWNLDGNALDSNDGTKNNGTATNVTYANTSVGFQKQAGVFNGSSSYVSVPHNSALSISSEVTITYTKTYDSTQTTYAVDVYKGYDSNGTTRINYAALLNSIGVQFMWYNTTWRVSSSVGFAPVNGTTYHIALKHTSGNGSLTKVYVNGIEYSVTHSGTGNEPLITNSDPLGIGAIIGYSPTSVTTAKGQIQSVRLYDRALSSQEIQTLYLESKRMIGNSGQPDVMSKISHQFESFGDDTLWETISGTVVTRTGGTATTDNLGMGRAITNPNYSWSPISYVAAYSWENSGSGWNLAKNPTGVSTTGINRTTTMRQLFLSSEALTASEEAQLAKLCEYSYPVRFTKRLTGSLTQGLGAHIDGSVIGTTAYDQSGNGNNGTLDASQTVRRRFQSKALVFTATDKISFPNTNGIRAVSAWIYPTANDKTIVTLSSGKTVSINSSNVITSTLTNPTYYVNGKVGVSVSLNKWNHIIVTFDSENSSSGSFGSDSFVGEMGDMGILTSPVNLEQAQNFFYSTYLQ